MTGLKREDSEHSKSKKSVGQTEKTNQTVTMPRTERLEIAATDVTQSYENLRMKATSPLDVEHDQAMQT